MNRVYTKMNILCVCVCVELKIKRLVTSEQTLKKYYFFRTFLEQPKRICDVFKNSKNDNLQKSITRKITLRKANNWRLLSKEFECFV